MSSSSQIAIGAHVEQTDPVAEAKARRDHAGAVLPRRPAGLQGPRDPVRRRRRRPARRMPRRPGVDLYVHAPYIVNVATTNNRIRIPSRKLLQQHMDAAAEIGAKGLIVHGGHVNKDDDPAKGFDNWRKAIEATDIKIPLLIENTAGGDNAMARHLDRIAGVWDAISEAEGSDRVGFCLDTCHAWAGGIELPTAVEKVRAITGRIDLAARQRQPGRLRLRRRPARQLRQRPARRGRLRGRRPRRRSAGHLRDPRWRGRAPGGLRVAARARRVTRSAVAGLLAASGAATLLSGCGGGCRRARSRREGQGCRGAPGKPSGSPTATTPTSSPTCGSRPGSPKGTVVLLHGGDWQATYGVTELEPLADRLTALGFVTWNVEYRRVGDGGGVPNTLQDVAAAIDRLDGDGLPAGITDRVVLLGHSAGGHLAAWAASRIAADPGRRAAGAPAGGDLAGGRPRADPRGQRPDAGRDRERLRGRQTGRGSRALRRRRPREAGPASCPVWAFRADNDEVVPTRPERPATSRPRRRPVAPRRRWWSPATTPRSPSPTRRRSRPIQKLLNQAMGLAGD